MTHSSQSTVGSFINLFSGKWIVDIVCSSLSTNVVSILYRMKLYLLGAKSVFCVLFQGWHTLVFCLFYVNASFLRRYKIISEIQETKKDFHPLWYKHVVYTWREDDIYVLEIFHYTNISNKKCFKSIWMLSMLSDTVGT